MPRRRAPVGPPPVRLARLRFFEHLFHSAGVGAGISDATGRVLHVNAAAERLYGWEPGTLAGHALDELVPPGQNPILREVLESGRSWSGVTQRRRKSGAIFPARLTVSPIRDETGEPIGLFAFIADDTPNQRRHARLASLTALGAALNAETDLETLLARICEEAQERFAVGGVYLSLLDEHTQELVGLVGRGPHADRVAGQRVPIANRTDALGRAIAERRATIAHDVRPEGDYAELIEAYQVRASLLAPLLSGRRVIGLLALNDTRRGDRFGPEDLELAQAFAMMAAVAIDGARLHEAERAQNERLLALAHVNRLLAASLEPEEVLEAIIAGAQRLLGVDEVVIWLLGSPTGPLRLAHYVTRSGLVPLRELDLQTSILGEVVQDGRPWQSADISSEPPEVRGRLTTALARGLKGALMIPLIARARPLGGIVIFSSEVRSFGAEEVELARAFAHQAALAVENAETLARERRASRLEHLVQRSRSLEPRDRLHVEQLLAAAERVIELAVSSQQSARSDPRNPPIQQAGSRWRYAMADC